MNLPDLPGGGMTISSSSFSSGRSLDASTRYMGMIELSTYKKTRNALFQLFDYVASESPSFFGLHAFITVWRVLQFFGPASCANYIFLWGEGSVMSKVWNYLSILYHLIPVTERKENDYKVLYFFFALKVVAYIFLGVSTKVYSQHAKLPQAVTNIISLYFSTIGYIFSPIVSILAGELIGRMIMDPDVYLEPARIVSVVLTFIVVISYAWLYKSVYSISITFKPDSLMTVVPSVQVQNVLLVLLITFCSGIASQLSKIPSAILSGITMILYGISIPAFSSKGGYVNENHIKALTATAVTGAFCMLCALIFTILDVVLSEIVLIIIVIVWIGAFIVTNFIYKSFLLKSTHTLDLIEEDSENFNMIKSIRKLDNLIVNGFRNAHPLCITFQIFKLAIDAYPTSMDVWLLFAKFTAIYPEATQQLVFILMGISQNHLKGALAKHTQQQIQSILRQRETNLITELKSKIDKIGKQVQATKHKVRYIWDLIIQGNVKDIETVINRAFASIDATEAEFQHLIRQFPNSRFVARSYARFLRDVVADHAGHKVWAQNVSMLQRGISIHPDKAHDLGVRAFPNIPTIIDNKLSSNNQPTGMITEDTLTQDIEGDDEKAANDAELRVSVRDSINRLSIPSYRNARIITIISLIILFFIPVIIMSVYTRIFVTNISEPLDFMYQISSLRTRAFQSIGSAYHYVLEQLNATNPDYDDVLTFPFERSTDIEPIEDPPDSFGYTYDSKMQTDFLNADLATLLSNLQEMMNYKPKDPTMNQVREEMYGNSINFTSISDPRRLDGFTNDTSDATTTAYNVTYSMKSAQASIMQFMISINDLVVMDEVPEDALNMHFITVPTNNIRVITDKLSDTLNSLCDYIITTQDNSKKTILIVMIVIICAVPIYYAIICAIIIIKINKEKMMIYKCLASLPKNTVSRVADSFKVLKKDEDDEMKSSRLHDEEVNKQEENMLKTFATSADSSHGKAKDFVVILVCTIFLILLHIAITLVFCLFLTSSGTKLSEAAPHIDYITASYAYDLASLILVNIMPSAVHPYQIYKVINFDIDTIIGGIYEWQERGINMYRTVRYGNSTLNAVPFTSLGIELDTGSGTEECQNDKVPESEHETYACWASDVLINFCQMKLKYYVLQYTKENHIFAGNDVLLKHLWHIHQVHIYDNYYSPMFTNIIPMVTGILENQIPTIIGVCIGLLILAIIVNIVLLGFLTLSQNRQKFALRLLLHCDGTTVVSNPHITALLSGVFTESHFDSTTRDSDFYDILVKNIPDSVIIMNLEGEIQSANQATKRIYGIDTESIIGKTLLEALPSFKGESPLKEIFEKQEKQQTEKSAIYLKDGNDEVYVEITFMPLGENLVLSTRDTTQEKKYKLIISDEKIKSDRLLSAILPTRLVSRVQNGEKNISFTVQSVSIVFIDIASFSSWGSSLPASTIMKTLNTLFQEFDALVNVHPTMTKVKCIGDCYMAAGGVFAEINQPAIHAKDVVEFGINSIQALIEINQRIEQNLKIRVGINTGGPIVAGILGTERPTFEILGPAINMALQMEHHGVANQVHITRAVYELIYGGNFRVKERGEIDIKNGHVVTYLITPPST